MGDDTVFSKDTSDYVQNQTQNGQKPHVIYQGIVGKELKLFPNKKESVPAKPRSRPDSKYS